jgi:hypothetical protein
MARTTKQRSLSIVSLFILSITICFFMAMNSSFKSLQIHALLQSQGSTVVNVYFPVEAQIYYNDNKRSRTGRIKKLNSGEVLLHDGPSILSEEISLITFSKNAYVRTYVGDSILLGESQGKFVRNISWKVRFNKINLADKGSVVNSAATVELDGSLPPSRVNSIINELRDNKILCRVNSLVYHKDQKITINGTFKKLP